MSWDAEVLGWVGLSLVVLSAIGAFFFIIGTIAAIIRDRRERKWRQRAESMISDWEGKVLARRLMEDRQVAWLESVWELPAAPGSWTRKDAA